MTDDDLLARLDNISRRTGIGKHIPDTCAAAAAVLRARDTELAAAVRERDSLARRCAVRFEESEKLRAELATAQAAVQAARAVLATARVNARTSPRWTLVKRAELEALRAALDPAVGALDAAGTAVSGESAPVVAYVYRGPDGDQILDPAMVDVARAATVTRDQL